MFQSTRPRGARRAQSWADCRGRDGFNPRALAGRDEGVVSNLYDTTTFQSTRPRGARLHVSRWLILRIGVSIHAPSRGATCFEIVLATAPVVFQSTRPRGARPCKGRLQHLQVFQSTRPRGARPQHGEHEVLSMLVSIHAPSRGATPFGIFHLPPQNGFNPRALAGRDPPKPRAGAKNHRFNPRALAGRDPVISCDD